MEVGCCKKQDLALVADLVDVDWDKDKVLGLGHMIVGLVG